MTFREYVDKAPLFTLLDRQFSRFMVKTAGESGSDLLGLAAALVSAATSQGHVCISLEDPLAAIVDEDEFSCPRLPDPTEWREALSATSVVGAPGDYRPLIVDEAGRLYLYKYWEYERRLATDFLRRVAVSGPIVNESLLNEGFARHLEGCHDRQVAAADTAVRNWFSVISGGPGTGKTSTVVKVLALLLEQEGPSLRVALAAPTGKAAARLGESITAAIDRLVLSEDLREALPRKVVTLHRLLGVREETGTCLFHRHRPLPFDVVVVDEASMIDLPLMAKLVEAVNDKARLVLLGDRDQLASVEAGAVLGDVCSFPEDDADDGQKSPLQSHIAFLTKSYRFGGGGAIAALSRSINAGDSAAARSLLDGSPEAVWKMCETPHDLEQLAADLVQAYLPAVTAEDPEEALRLFSSFRILCPFRKGHFGVEAINALVAKKLASAGVDVRSLWYHGRQIMVTKNDYSHGLFNGDTGIILRDGEAGLRAFFPGAAGVRRFLPQRLPDHETVYAMTVHKSQGSEFDRVVLILPDQDSPHLSRELIYTGVTRARQSVELWGREDVLAAAVERKTRRSSGLRDLLWSGGR